MSKTLNQCKKGKDFVAYAEHNGGEVVRQTGSHAIVQGPSGGICSVPVHPRDLAPGTRHSIIKQFTAIGLGVAILVGIIALLPVL